MLRVGIAGIGFMGWIHWLAYQRVEGVQVTAIMSGNEKKRSGDWRGIKGNFGPPGAEVDLEGIAAHADFAALLADENVDVVDICTPPNTHPEMAQEAFAAGKHVFCEKPIALTEEDCEAMVEAAAAADRQLLIGHVLPYFPEFAAAREIIASGKYGAPIGGVFKRVISDPTWIGDFYNPKTVGGPLIDLNVHDAHFIRLLFGMPTAVISQGRMRDEVVEYCNTQFEFDDPSIVVSAMGGVINQQGRPFMHGFEIHLEKATLHFELAVLADTDVEICPLKILDDQGKVILPELPGGDDISGFVGEIEEVLRSIASNEASPILGGELARDAVILCERQTESVRGRRRIEV